MDLEQRVSAKALKVWRLTGAIIAFVFLLVAFVLTIVATVFDWVEWVVYASWISVVVVTFLFVYLLPTLRWRWWRYEVRDEEIEIQKGLFVIKRTLVPMVRVQHVDTKQGPIMRKNDLATVEVSTAATVHEIPALDRQEAERLRLHIAEMVKVVKEDV
ncbi:MAG: PH domain-containing protein [Bacillus sp. (in: firmicutes)]